MKLGIHYGPEKRLHEIHESCVHNQVVHEGFAHIPHECHIISLFLTLFFMNSGLIDHEFMHLWCEMHLFCVSGPKTQSLVRDTAKVLKFWCLSLGIVTLLSQETVMVVHLLLGGWRGDCII